MTLQEAIDDKKRPLSVSPSEWMQYSEAREHEEIELVDKEAVRIVASENQEVDENSINLSCEERLDIGIEQMVLGCKMVIRAMQEINRMDLDEKSRSNYDSIDVLIKNAVAPYLADVLKSRAALIRKE